MIMSAFKESIEKGEEWTSERRETEVVNEATNEFDVNLHSPLSAWQVRICG